MKLSDFRNLDLADAKLYTQLYAKNPEQVSDSSFTNLWAWAEFYNLKFYFTGDNCFTYKAKFKPCFWLPAGAYETIDFEALYEVCKCPEFERVPYSFVQFLEEKFPGKVQVQEERDFFDYLYLKDDLANLSGNKFHRKKNHVNSFRKSYGVDYKTFSDDIIDDVLTLQDEWCKWHDCENSPSLQAEDQAILRVLLNYNKIPNLIGGALYVEDTMVAYTVAEALANETLLVHFEKGHSNYKGVYQAINQIFLQNEADSFKLVNREQDMGEEGLRQAKESYYPSDFMKKYRVKITG